MRIGLTIDSLAPALTGIGRYTWELCEALQRRSDIAELGYFRFDEWFSDPAIFLSARARRRFRRPPWLRRILMRRGFRGKLIHGTNYFLPDAAEGGVLTVHDMSIYAHPETHPPERVRSFEKGFEASLRRAGHVITDSEATRVELLSRMSIEPERVTAVYLGVANKFRPIAADITDPILQRIAGIRAGGYILCVATFEPRKRIEQAILAHAQLCSKGDAPPLVLVGARGWQNNALHDLIEKQARGGALIVIGHAAEEDLPFLYAGARLFLYPSIYEGFGLPPIEAMASAVPTIVANRSCLPEVTRGAAMMIDPDDVDAFAAAIRKALEDDNWRAETIGRGLDVAAGYTWEKCVENTVDVYRKVWASDDWNTG